MSSHSVHSQKGTVILVTLCFVAVIGIALASYIAVCSRAMTLSGRSVQSGLSKQLAELGLEEALRAFNGNYLSGTSTSASLADWSANGITVDWTLDTANKRATANLTFSSPATKFGASVANASVKIRVDNYDAAQLPATWSSSANYRIGDLVGYNGTWYRAVQNHSNQTPNGIANLAYWVPEGIGWQWSNTISYRVGDAVNYNGTWYYCSAAHSGHVPPNASYWTVIPAIKKDDTLGVFLVPEAIVNWFGTWYRWNSGGYWDNAPPIFWRWQSGYTYVFNDIVCYSNTWYRCILSTSSAAPTNTTYWTPLANAWTWNSSYNYKIGDVAYRSGSWYRCLVANSNHQPPNSAYWSNSPLLSLNWDSGRQYSQHDPVYYNGTWYRSLQNSNISQNPSTQTSYWASAANATYQWSSITAYSAGTYCSYGGVWYQCLVGNTGKSPNNTTYWTAAWTNSSSVTTGAPVAYAESTVALGDGSTTKTQLRATLSPAPLFPNALAGVTAVTVTGAGTVDSYDATAGTYASQTPGYSAVIAGGDTTGTAVTIGSTIVKGYFAAPSSSSSPYAPLYSIGASVSLTNPDGTVISPHPTAASVDLTRISRSPYIPAFDTLPTPSLSSVYWSGNLSYGTGISFTTTTNLGTAGATTPSIYHYDASLLLGSGQTLNIQGPVMLYINGYLRANTGTLVVHSTGSAEIHFTSSLRSYSGSGGFINRTKDPKKLILIGDVSSTTSCYLYPFNDPLTPQDNAFYGVIYMPNTTATGGVTIQSSSLAIFGAVSAKNITFTADANVHYDTSLRYATIPGVDQPYAIAQWRELTDATELATMP